MPYYRCPECGLLSHSVAGYSTTGVCANCSAKLPAEAKLEVVSEPTTAVNRNIRAGLSAPAQARRVMSGLPVDETVQNKLALVASELVTNSLRHAGLAAGDPIELRAARDNGTVLISVHDGGPGFEPRERRADAPAGGGAGLAIVDSLADRWGVDQDPDGCTVWCLVAAS